jgi:hypothetical protein
MMTDWENSPAYAALPRCARRVFAAIERTIGDGSIRSMREAVIISGTARESVKAQPRSLPAVPAEIQNDLC